MQGIRHFVECRCVLPIFKNKKSPPSHQIAVFSLIDDDDNVKMKFVQCENCGIIHKVHEIGKSTIISNKEEMNSLVTRDDVLSSFSEKLVTILEKNNVSEISTLEEIKFTIESENWGHFIVLSRDTGEGVVNVKLLKFLSKNMFVVDNEVRENLI